MLAHEHYRKAEEILAEVDNQDRFYGRAGFDVRDMLDRWEGRGRPAALAAAQVHATLAHAATVGTMTDAVSVYTCDVADGDGPRTCTRVSNHLGKHQAADGTRWGGDL